MKKFYYSLDWKQSWLKKLLLISNIATFLLIFSINPLLANSVEKETTNNQEQIKTITGKVIDPSGDALPGVNVYEKNNPQNGVITGSDGIYSIQVTDANDLLVFSFIGFFEQEITITGKTTINVTLEEEFIGLNEVVAVGYGIQKKATLTGAVTNLNVSDLSDESSSNMTSLLAGRMSGVSVSNTMGTPGIASELKIRETASWNANPPIYVIDGIVRPKEDFDKLDVSEVANVSILKDGASAAIYGARAAGGVVLVQTKQGKAGKTSFEYNMSYTFEEPTKLPEMMRGVDVAKMGNSYLPESDWAYWNDEDLAWLGTINNGDGFDHLEEVYQTPNSTRHALNVSGGSDKIKYFIGGSFFDQNGFVENLGYEKYNIRSNITADVTDNLTATLQMSNINSTREKFNWTFDWDDDALPDLWKKLQTWQYYEAPSLNGYAPNTGWVGNVAELIGPNSGYWEQKEQVQNVAGSLQYDVPFVKGLSVKGTYSYRYFNAQKKVFSKKHKLYNITRESTHSFPSEINDPDDYVMSDGPGREFLQNESQTNNSYQLNGQINYDRTFGKHQLGALFVYEQSEETFSKFGGTRYDFPIVTTDQYFATSDNREDSEFNGQEFETGRSSYVGRLNYDYDSKYMVTASFRYDGSMIFGPDQQWGFFPSVSAGWRISEEDFFQSDVINNLKIRGSVGLLGNDWIDNNRDDIQDYYIWQQKYVPSNNYYLGSNPSAVKSIRSGGLVNPNVTWEKSLNYNIGVDVTFARKFNATVEYWMKKQTDILGNRSASVPTTFGVAMAAENYGEVHANGIELELSYNDNIGDFKYHISGMLGYATSEVIKKDYAENAPDIDIPIGRSLEYITGFQHTGMIRNEADLAKIPEDFTVYGRKPTLGDLTYEDISGPDGKADGKIDDYDLTILHDYKQAPLNFGLNLGAEWKGFSIDALFQGNAGGKKYYSMQGPYPWTRTYAFYEDYWTPENENASMPNADYRYGQNRMPSSFYLESTSFVRLKYLNVGYNLPKSLLSKVGVEGCKIFFSGNNLFYLSKFEVYDPEVDHAGVYPNMKTFSFGINLKI